MILACIITRERERERERERRRDSCLVFRGKKHENPNVLYLNEKNWKGNVFVFSWTKVNFPRDTSGGITSATS